jgi:hypothetical protein
VIRPQLCALHQGLVAMIETENVEGRQIMNRMLCAVSRSGTLRFVALAAVFLAAPASAKVINNNGQFPYVQLSPPQLQAATSALQNSCGRLRDLARSTNGVGTVIALKYWHSDQYANQTDPHNGHVYGNHLTAAAKDGATKAGIWHYYQSGAAWADNSANPDPEGRRAIYKCNH